MISEVEEPVVVAKPVPAALSAPMAPPAAAPAMAPVAALDPPSTPPLPLSPSLEAMEAVPEETSEQDVEEIKEAEENPFTDTARMKTIEVHTQNNIMDASQQLLTRVINYPTENTIRFIVYKNSQNEIRVEISTTNGPMQISFDTLQSVMKDIEGSVEWFAGEEERQKQEEAALAAVPPIDRWFDDWFDYALAVISICCVLGMFYFMVIEERLG